jgi:YjbR
MSTTAHDFRRIAMALEGTTSAPHFDRTAFKVARTYATLAPDGRTGNLKLAPDEQALKCITAPDAFKPVPNAWGEQGWTTARLAALSPAELEAALEMAWKHARPRPRARRPSRTKG